MKAVLLAAGRGTRLRPRTETTPKCMLPVGGRPILERTIDWLRGQDVVELAINLHHRPEIVVDRLGDGSRHGVSIRYSYEPTLRGTAGAVRALAPWLARDRFFVVYADNLISCDLRRLAAVHGAASATLTVALFWRKDVSRSGVATLDGDGRVTAFREKPSGTAVEGRWVSAGLLLCEPAVLRSIPSDVPSDFGYDVLPALLAAGETLAGYRMTDPERLDWIDTPAELEELDSRLRSGARG